MLWAPFLGAFLVFLAPRAADPLARAEGTSVQGAAAFTSLLPPALVFLSALAVKAGLGPGQVFEMPLAPRWAGGGVAVSLGHGRLLCVSLVALAFLAANLGALCMGRRNPSTYASMLLIEGAAVAYVMQGSLWPLLPVAMAAALALRLAASRADRSPRPGP